MFGLRLAASHSLDHTPPRKRDRRLARGLGVIQRFLRSGRILSLQTGSSETAAQHQHRLDRSEEDSPPRVRPVRQADIERICDLLHREWPRVGAQDWRRLFDYGWLEAKPTLGFVLTRGDDVVGFIGTVYAHRRINGRAGLVCNLTSWCVLPKYRRWSVGLFMAALRDQSVSYTNLTAGSDLVRVFERVGFRSVAVQRVVMPPLFHAETLRCRSARIVVDPDEIRAVLDDDQRRIFDDHAPCGCLHLALVEGRNAAYLIVKRRVRRGLPVSELLHCSAPDVLLRHLEHAKLAVLCRQRTLALVADAYLFLAARPRGLTGRRVVLVRSPTFSAGEIGNLYSERVLLPV